MQTDVQIKLRNRNRKLFLRTVIFSVLMLSIQSCRVTLLPAYDAGVAEQIDKTAQMVDRFYLQMLEMDTINKGRAYEKFIQQYIDIEVELNSLYYKNKVRSLNENSIRICEITLQLWVKYKQEHKVDNTLSNGIIQLNKKTFEDLFYAMQSAEKAKELINNPPD